MILLGECKPLHAKITERQCEINRQGGHISCKGCVGLGEPAQALSTVREAEPVANIKKYVCVEEGCNKLQSKNRRCHVHNKAYVVAQQKEAAELDATGEVNLCAGSHQDLPAPGYVTGGPTGWGPIIESAALKLPDASATNDELDAILDAITAESFEPIGSEIEEVLVNGKVEKLPKLTGLAALLPMATPLPEPDGLLIPFTREEVVALIESNVTAEDIRDLAKMLLAGELQRVAVA